MLCLLAKDNIRKKRSVGELLYLLSNSHPNHTDWLKLPSPALIKTSYSRSGLAGKWFPRTPSLKHHPLQQTKHVCSFLTFCVFSLGLCKVFARRVTGLFFVITSRCLIWIGFSSALDPVEPNLTLHQETEAASWRCTDCADLWRGEQAHCCDDTYWNLLSSFQRSDFF